MCLPDGRLAGREEEDVVWCDGRAWAAQGCTFKKRRDTLAHADVGRRVAVDGSWRSVHGDLDEHLGIENLAYVLREATRHAHPGVRPIRRDMVRANQRVEHREKRIRASGERSNRDRLAREALFVLALRGRRKALETLRICSRHERLARLLLDFQGGHDAHSKLSGRRRSTPCDCKRGGRTC